MPFRIPGAGVPRRGAALRSPSSSSCATVPRVTAAGDGIDVALSETVPGATIRSRSTARCRRIVAALRRAAARRAGTGRTSTVAAIAVLHDGRRSAPAFLDVEPPGAAERRWIGFERCSSAGRRYVPSASPGVGRANGHSRTRAARTKNTAAPAAMLTSP